MDLTAIYNRITSNIVSDLGQCVLLLGPELSVDKYGNYYKSYFKQLEKDEESYISNYFSAENLFAFVDEYGSSIITEKIKNFYDIVGDRVLLDMISRIEFPLIFNVCPDKALNKVYCEKNITFESGFFSKESKPLFNNLPLPSKKLPIIYNIFGSIDNDQSIILTHAKLFETIEHLLPEKSLPDNIEIFLKNASSFIFLGFKFDSWYYQLICHKLGLVTVNSKKASLSVPSYEDNVDTVSIVMGKYFNMNFTQENPAQTIENIIEHCERKKPGSLRPKNALLNQHYGVFISYARNDELEDLLGLIIFTIKSQKLKEKEKIKSLIEIFKKAGVDVESENELLEIVSTNNDENLSLEIQKWYNEFIAKHRPFQDENDKQNYKREDIVNLIEIKLKDKGGQLMQVFRDRTELTYGDSIDSFMNRIGKGKTVIRVISDKYLKSRYCMDEALRIQRYSDNEKRIFTVVLNDTQFSAEEKIMYKKYWETMVENIYGKIDSTIKNKIDKERVKRNYGVYIEIYDFIDDFIANIQDEVYLETNMYKVEKIPKQDSPEQNAFDNFINTIINKMKEE
jgi:TIR domain/SIR2-like domain